MIRQVRPLGNLDLRDRLRHDEVEISVALAMTMRDHIDRGAVDRDVHVRAVIDVKPTQEDLLGLPTAGMLRCNEPGHNVQEVLRRVLRGQGKIYRTKLPVSGSTIDPRRRDRTRKLADVATHYKKSHIIGG